MGTTIKYFSILSLFLFWGCSPGPGTSKLKVSIAAITGSAQFPGGLFLMGKGDGNKFIYKVKADDTLELELNHGKYDFLVMGWDANNYYEGNVYCDFREGLKVEGEQLDLSMSASMGGCDKSFLHGGPIGHGLGQFPTLNMQSCSGLKRHLDMGEVPPAGMACDSGSNGLFPGGDHSYRVSLVTQDLEKKSAVNSFSRCLSIGASGSALRLPKGLAGHYEVPVQIETFSDTACASNKTTYLFERGLVNLANDNLAITAVDYSALDHSVYLHKDLCNEAHRAGNPFAISDFSEGRHLICNKAQFERIGQLSTAEHEFELGANIEFGGSNTTISTIFSGSIRGEGFALRGGNSPLFDNIRMSSPDEQRIHDFSIENFNVNISTGADGGSFGLLANLVDATPTGSKLEFHDIEVTGSRIEISDLSVASATYLGGLFGELMNNDAGANSNIYLRKIQSFADVLSPTSVSITTGGIAGRMGSDANSGSVRVEIVSVGVNNPDNLQDISERVSVRGSLKVGGIAGSAEYSEFRRGIKVVAQLEGNSYIGGVLGEARNQISLDGNEANIIFRRALGGGGSSRIGGAIGGIPTPGNFYLENLFVRLDALPSSNVSETVNQIGGIVGGASALNSDNGDSLRISNSKAYITSAIDGSYHGGFIGSFVDSGAGTPQSEISTSIAMGRIEVQNEPNAANSLRGGMVGAADLLRINLSIADIDKIEGYSSVGGAIGEADRAEVMESYIDAEVECYRINEIECGGIAGSILNSPGTNLNNIKARIEMTVPGGVTNCNGTAACGTLVGRNFYDGLFATSNLIVGSITSTVSAPVDNLCYGSCVDSTNIFNIVEDDSTCGALTGPFVFNSTCDLAFETKWKAFGYEAISDPHYSMAYLAGNSEEPFAIDNESDWNDIGDDMFLMHKAFSINAPIAFSSFQPIGSASNSFKGVIFGNGNELSGISHTSTSMFPGLFGYIDNARIGDYGSPLVLSDVNIDCNSQPNCGIVGSVLTGGGLDLIMHARNVDIFNGGNSVGGFVGTAAGRLNIRESSFQGKVSASGSDIGGLVGYSYTSGNGGVSIKDVGIFLDEINGDDNIGGFLGNSADVNDKIEIERSFLVVDGSNLNTPNWSGSTGLNMAAFVGNFGGGDGELEIRESFADLKNLRLGSGDIDLVIGRLPAGIPTYNSEDVYLISPNVDVGLEETNLSVNGYVTDSAHLGGGGDVFRSDDSNSDWLIDSTGELRLNFNKTDN